MFSFFKKKKSPPPAEPLKPQDQLKGTLSGSDAAQDAVVPEATQTEREKERLQEGLKSTRSGFLDKLKRNFLGRRKVDADFLDQLEEVLIGSDVGVPTTIKILDALEKRAGKDAFMDQDELQDMLRDEMVKLFPHSHVPDTQPQPYVILVVGVNGVGKTTTIGKLAQRWKGEGAKVVLGAADTFRAAAVEQLKLWGQRTQTEVVEKGMNADPGAVAFDAVKRGIELKADVVLVDTAGRLHNKAHLMKELTRIRNVMNKALEGAPHQVWLVLDATTGQNALEQARQFKEATQLDGIILTKLDGTAKGGVTLGVAHEMQVPVKYVGVGEKASDLLDFDPNDFVRSLFRDGMSEQQAKARN